MTGSPKPGDAEPLYRFRVTRTWYVDAESPTDAIERTKGHRGVGKHVRTEAVHAKPNEEANLP